MGTRLRVENPFFVREVRAYARKAWSPLGWMLLAGALLPLFPLGLTERFSEANGRMIETFLRGLVLFTLGVSHGGLCAASGWMLGVRVFGAEHRQNTLESLRLVSASPWWWVVQKLAFPLYALTLVWAAALPGYSALVIRGSFLPQDLWPGLTLAAGFALLTFAAALVISPERIGAPRVNDRTRPLAERLETGLHRLLPLWIGWMLISVGGRWITDAAAERPLRLLSRRLFGPLWLREDQIAGLLLGLLLVYALTAAWTWANPASLLARRLRTVMQALTVGVGYLVFLGLTWAGSWWIWKVLVTGFPLLQVLRLVRQERVERQAKKSRKPRKEGARSPGEILALQRRWDNPVLIRDLRVALRGSGLLWTFLGQCLAIFLIALGMMALLVAGPMSGIQRSGYLLQAFAGTMCSILGWIAFVTSMRIGSRAMAQWSSERRMNTISQLLLTPLSGRAIIRGRLAAALVEGLLTALPWILSFYFFLLVATQGREPGLSLCLGAWFFSLALVISVGCSAALRPMTRWRDLLTTQGAVAATCVAEVFLLIWGLVKLTGNPSEVLLGCTILFTLVNVVSIPVLLSMAAREIERYREEALG